MKPKFVIPMHYGTNPLNKGTPQEYMQALGNTPTKVLALKPGEKAEF
jgi:L-ascorbate metabolism protein UlaG (beta-lactamase superfamily)